MNFIIFNFTIYFLKFSFLNIFIFIYTIILCFSNSKESICNEEFPFYNKIYNYCVEHCTHGTLLSSSCIPSSEINSSIEETINIIEELLKNSTIKLNNYEYIINGENVVFQITNTEILKQNINMNNAFSNSYLNLGECENNLKTKNSIKSSEPLIIVLINKINSTLITTYNKGFFIYDPISKIKLNILDSCNSVKDILYFNISVSSNNNINTLNYSLFSKKGYILADPKSPFFRDICLNYTFEYDTDIPLTYRKKIYKKYTFDVCGDNCIMVEYDLKNNKIFCKCYTSYNNKILVEGKDKNILDNAKLNFNVLQCYKNIIKLNYKKIYKNICFIILSFLLLLFILLMIIYFLRKNKSFKEIVNNVMNSNKDLLNRINQLSKSKYYKNNNKTEDEKERQNSNYYSSRTNPLNIISREIKDNSKKYLIIQNENNLNEKIYRLNKRNEKENQSNNIENNYLTKKIGNFNTRVIQEKKIIVKAPEPEFDYSKYFFNAKNNKINKKEKEDLIYVSEKCISRYTEYNIVKKINKIEKGERLLFFCDTEMNLFEYEKALEIDTRSFLRYY